MEKEGPTGFCHMSVFSFSVTILSGGIGARELMMNTRGAKVGFEAIACKLTTTITLKIFLCEWNVGFQQDFESE